MCGLGCEASCPSGSGLRMYLCTFLFERRAVESVGMNQDSVAVARARMLVVVFLLSLACFCSAFVYRTRLALIGRAWNSYAVQLKLLKRRPAH